MPLLDRYPERLRRPLLACASGSAPPNIALMQFLIEAANRDEADTVLGQIEAELAAVPESDGAGRLRGLVELWTANPQAFATVKAVLDRVDHGGTAANPEDGVVHWASRFDRMAQASPEGGVALYALGNPDLLNAATAEVEDCLRSWGLLGPNKSLLEIGCGIGRFVAALSPEVGHVTGIDISAVMIARARERCAGLANVALEVTSGRDLEEFGTGSIDVILGADLVQRHVSEAARVLKPGGSLVIFNYSYRGDADADRAEVSDRARRSGLRLSGTPPAAFTLWDASAFHLVKD
jgi:predicted TPR repeat methyltransferase